MKINSLDVDGYGVWSNLKLDGLSDGLNVFCGPNEAGKTTLMHFVRSMLYGFAPERRHYLPPVRGGRPGGSLEVAGPNGQFHLSRHNDNQDSGTPARAVLSASDGSRQGEQLLNVLLSNVDEPIFNNVFAFGLREIQELGTLGDTEAAALLFNITAGLDRVSLVDTMRELRNSRNRMLRDDGKPCQLVQLTEQRDRLRDELEELASLTGQYTRLASQRDLLDREVARLEDDKNQFAHDARVLEIAVTVRDRWLRRAELDEQLAAMRSCGNMPDGAIEQLDRIRARLDKHQERITQIGRRRRHLRAEASELKVNEALWRQSARIEALQEQEGWINTLRDRTSELETEILAAEEQLATERQQLGLGEAAESLDPAALVQRDLRKIRRSARTATQSRRALDEARQQSDTARQAAASLTTQIATTLSARGEEDLAGAIDRSGGLVSQLRRRVQLDERLEQMTTYHDELERQSRDLLSRQLLPAWVLALLGSMFVAGVILLVAGLASPESIIGTLGWACAILGATGAGVAVGIKVMLERSNARKLDACQKQLNMLQLQLQQANEERESLDQSLSGGSGPLATRLAEAERDLSGLEELMPLETRRQTAQQEADAAAARTARAEEEFNVARRRWRETLGLFGLPENLSPKQVRELLGRCDHLAQLIRRVEHSREELRQRQGELDGLRDRITQLATDTGLSVATGNPIELLRQLGEEVRRQESLLQQRHRLRDSSRKLRRKRTKLEAATRRLKQRRRELLEQIGVETEDELRRRSKEYARAEELRRERRAVQAEIDAALGGHCEEEAIAEQLADSVHNADGANADLESRWDELDKRVQATQSQLKERFEKRGQLGLQLEALAKDSRPAAKQMELSMVEKQLDDAVRRWQVLAVTCRILESIKKTYEEQRQPETLQEASGYLRRLTNGRYARVWTPLGEDMLWVDDGEGHSIKVEVLSRGTREQLFLSLRLALVSSYARRGAQLPLVLDDVLVNFDAPRAKAAAEVLRDFARAGHQLLVFTCHDHIFSLFKSLKVDVKRLPSSEEVASAPPVAPKKSKKKKRSKKAKSAPEPAAEVEEPPIEEEPVELVAEEAPWEEPEDEPVEEMLDEAEEDDEEYDESEDELEDEYEYEWEEEDEDEDYDNAEAA